MRQIILDTETTGLSPQQGHRIIEIGCLEMINRRLTGRSFHYYLQPDRAIDPGATNVHGITNAFLKNKPRFADIVSEFKDFIEAAELIIHNAPFDLGFLNSEFARLNDPWENVEGYFKIVDTLAMARQKHPGQRNNLDALCKRYGVDNQHREKHGALLDAEILAKVYLHMTGGQETLVFEEKQEESPGVVKRRTMKSRKVIEVPRGGVTLDERAAHEAFLLEIEKKSGKKAIFREYDDTESF